MQFIGITAALLTTLPLTATPVTEGLNVAELLPLAELRGALVSSLHATSSILSNPQFAEVMGSDMIGKNELRAKFSDLISSADSPAAMQEKIAEFITYSIENYERLDAEAKTSVDRTFVELQKQTKTAIERMPEGTQKREFERVLGAVEGKH